MVDPLEYQQLLVVDVHSAPGPHEVPGGPQVQAVGKLSPVPPSKERLVDDVVDLG